MPCASLVGEEPSFIPFGLGRNLAELKKQYGDPVLKPAGFLPPTPLSKGGITILLLDLRGQNDQQNLFLSIEQMEPISPKTSSIGFFKRIKPLLARNGLLANEYLTKLLTCLKKIPINPLVVITGEQSILSPKGVLLHSSLL
jgi:hypothetical protein